MSGECDEIYMPALVYETDDELAIRFIDGRHIFVTLYKNLRAPAQGDGPAKPGANVPARGRVRGRPRFT